MSHADFNEDHVPLGFLITFRTYGTWLHGDKRGSVDRNHRRYGTAVLPPSPRREHIERKLLQQPPLNLNRRQRVSIDSAIRETCARRRWELWALNIRTNHIHSVITATCNSQNVLVALKANATRSMREAGCWESDLSPWSRGGSRRRLWTEDELNWAITYVVEDQREPLD
jgi:REP element-mobilizing transposase RayT